jgi:hypothetical protein
VRASPVPTTTVTFIEQVGDVLNPERGWWRETAIGGSFRHIRDPIDPDATPPTTITLVKMDFDQTKADIPTDTLAALAATAAAADDAGVKIVLRPVYRMDDKPESGVDPTDVAFVVSHVRQLGPTVRATADVIAVVQLGMLGPWGEFHESSLIDNGQWVAILKALLEEVPTSRMVQVRRPCYKAHFFGGRGPLTDAEAFSGSDVARVGHFNDCFLGDTLADQGTYENPPGVFPVKSVDEWRDYAATDTRWTFVGGETCGNNARASCESALGVPVSPGVLAKPGDLPQFHWSFLGSGWYQPTVGPTGVLAACRDEITERLGYRLVLEEAIHSTAVRPGHSLVLRVRLRNDGFAPPVNPRPVFVVLHAGATAYLAELGGVDADPRRWAPGETRTLSRTIAVPASVAEGTYALSLWLPDAGTSIRARPEYAVRFVNAGTWEAATGHNVLTQTLTISSGATANTDPADATFAT